MLFIVPVFSEENKFKSDYSDFTVNYGQAHYSWILVFKKICRALEAASIPFKIITRPEVYTSGIAKQLLLGANELSPIHVLHVRPIELIRPMVGALNSCYYLWEFEDIPKTWLQNSPYFNFKNQLNLLDHIFTANDTFKNFLTSEGFPSVSTLPIPLSNDDNNFVKKQLVGEYTGCLLNAAYLAQTDSIRDPGHALADACFNKQEKLSEFLQRQKEKDATVLLTVANPWDPRKNIYNQIKAVSEHCAEYNVALVIKSTLTNVEPWNLFGDLIVKKHGNLDIQSVDSIWMTSEFFESTDLDALYQSVDGYLCTSYCEGLNLPLIEAIKNRCPIITPLHSAMAGYLEPESCYTIPHKRVNAFSDSSCLGNSYELHWNYCTVEDIYSSITSFINASERELEAKSNNAQKNISSKYNLNNFVKSISEWHDL